MTNTLELSNEFKKACENIKQSQNLSNETLLELYGLYKQSTEGDCNSSKPSFWDVKGCAKWNAWNDNVGLDKDTAMKRYVRKVKKILE
jgi:diazepam-binding inhibitor (GABA receptor modulating acyl-CoA-binding protein)